MRQLLTDVPSVLAERVELQPLRWALTGRSSITSPAYAAYRATLARNLLLGAALDQALDALGAAGIQVQPLKGALFIETLYGGDAGARPMSDLDLLVSPIDLERAQAVLVGLGYRPFGMDRVRWSKRFAHHRILCREAIVVELHWRLCHDLAIDGDSTAFFQDTRAIKFRGRPLAVARDELQLFYTLVHAATHGLLHSAVWIVDARLLAAGAVIDWEYLQAYARAHRAARAIGVAARLVNSAFPGTLPIDKEPGCLRDRVLARLMAANSGPLPYGPGLRSLAIRSLLTDRVVDAGRVLSSKALLRVLEALE